MRWLSDYQTHNSLIRLLSPYQSYPPSYRRYYRPAVSSIIFECIAFELSKRANIHQSSYQIRPYPPLLPSWYHCAMEFPAFFCFLGDWIIYTWKKYKINVSDILNISLCENLSSQFFILDNFPFFFSPFSSLLLFFSLLAVSRLLVGWQMAAPQDNLSDLCCKNSPHHSSFSSALQVTS